MSVILFEHYVTLFDSDSDMTKKEEYLDQVWSILQDAYAAIGGIANIDEKEELLDEDFIWKLVTKNKKVLAVQLYKRKGGGRKIFVGGCLPTEDGKKAFYNLASEDVKRLERDAWAEVSGSMEGVYLFKLHATPIPAEKAAKILGDMGKKIISISNDGFHYTRKIGGKSFEKIMFGNVPKQYRTDDWEKESERYKKDFADYNAQHPDEVEARKNAHRNKR